MRIRVEDGEEKATSKIVDRLMGNKPEERFRFITLLDRSHLENLYGDDIERAKVMFEFFVFELHMNKHSSEVVLAGLGRTYLILCFSSPVPPLNVLSD